MEWRLVMQASSGAINSPSTDCTNFLPTHFYPIQPRPWSYGGVGSACTKPCDAILFRSDIVARLWFEHTEISSFACHGTLNHQALLTYLSPAFLRPWMSGFFSHLSFRIERRPEACAEPNSEKPTVADDVRVPSAMHGRSANLQYPAYHSPL